MTPVAAGEWQPKKALDRWQAIEAAAGALIGAIDERRNGETSGTAVRIAEARLRQELRPLSEWEPVR